MHGLSISRRTLATAAAGLAAVLILALAVSPAHAGVISPSGQINGCYVKKGKAKGTLRVVAPGKHCKRSEKRIAWSAQGQAGGQGTQGTGGNSSQVTQLQDRVTQLESQVTQLTSQLSQVTGVLGSLTNTDLTSAVNSVADVSALCAEAPTLVDQANSLRTVLNGLALGGVIPIGLALTVPSLPAALTPFTCP